MDEPASDDAGKSRSADRINSALLLLVVVGLWAFRLGGPIDLRWDAGVYYLLGTSLYEGKGYRLLNEPGEIRAVQYPPLLPAIVAAHQWAAGDARPAVAGHLFRWTMAVITAAYVLAAYRVARWWLPPIAAFAAALLVSVHSTTVFMSDLCFAEVPFGLVCLGFIALNRTGRRWPHEAVTGVMGAACYFLRTLGLAVLAAWVLEAAFRRRFGLAALRATVAAIPVLAWQAYVANVTHSPDYAHPAYAYQRAAYLMYNVSYAENLALFDPFAPEKGPATLPRVAMRTLDNILALPATFGEAVSAPAFRLRGMLDRAKLLVGRPLGWLTGPLTIALGSLVLVGIGSLAMRREWLIVLFIGATSAMICLSPWPQQFNRYFSPIAPLLVVSLILGASAVRGWLRQLGPSWGRAANAGVVALVAGLVPCVAYAFASLVYGGGYAPYADDRGVSRPYRLFYYNDTWSDFDSALAWLKQTADPGDVIATAAPHWTYLNTGLKAVTPPSGTDPRRSNGCSTQSLRSTASSTPSITLAGT